MTTFKRNFLAAGLLTVSLLAGCAEQPWDQPEFTEPMTLGGVAISPDVLNNGREAFMLNCYACHGALGKGDGPSSPGLRPPPRDFTAGIFKFAGVAAGQLPHDSDLLRTITRGLDGTPMLAWDIPDVERMAIIQYLKTLSPRWKDEKPGERVLPTPDPWQGKDAEAVAKGSKLYHGFVGCSGCHGSYVSFDAFAQVKLETQGAAPTELSAAIYAQTLTESVEYQVKIPAPDFLFGRIKNGTTLEELYRTIAAGIGGAAMPSWKELPQPDLWALVHYVKSIIDLRDTPAGNALRAKLTSQPAYVPPPPPAPPIDPNAPNAPAVPAPSK
ncbi:MAG: c-type cytochrome [Myxococcota bacterium]